MKTNIIDQQQFVIKRGRKVPVLEGTEKMSLYYEIGENFVPMNREVSPYWQYTRELTK